MNSQQSNTEIRSYLANFGSMILNSDNNSNTSSKKKNTEVLVRIKGTFIKILYINIFKF